MTHATPMFELEHHGSIDVLQIAYAGYLGRFRGNTFIQYEYQLGRFFKWVPLAPPVPGPVDQHGAWAHDFRAIPVRRSHRHRLVERMFGMR